MRESTGRIGINEFVMRQTKDDFVGTRLTMEDLQKTLLKVEMIFIKHRSKNCKTKLYEVKNGYAPFCKEVLLYNFPLASPIAEINDSNIDLVRSHYRTRRHEELAFLSQYFPKDSKVKPIPAHHVLVVLYAYNHLIKEGGHFSGCNYDIICVNAEPYEEVPMTPVTMIRNHMGIEFGGSGISLDVERYKESVAFWSTHAMVEQ